MFLNKGIYGLVSVAVRNGLGTCHLLDPGSNRAFLKFCFMDFYLI